MISMISLAQAYNKMAMMNITLLCRIAPGISSSVADDCLNPGISLMDMKHNNANKNPVSTITRMNWLNLINKFL